MVAEETLAATRHGHTADADGAYGAPPALVLMHFLGGSQREWDEVLPLLAPDQASVTVDLPGFGASADIPGYRVGEMVNLLEATLRELNLPRFVLVGHSMSGKVAAVLARCLLNRQDAGLKGLVLIAPSPPGPEPMSDEKRHGMIASLGTLGADDYERARRYITRNEERDIPAEVQARAANEVLRMNRTAWVAWLTHGSREDFAAEVGVLDLPALVVAGEKDASLGPKQQREFTLPHLAQGSLRVVEGCSHLIPMERPVELAGILTEFVATLG